MKVSLCLVSVTGSFSFVLKDQLGSVRRRDAMVDALQSGQKSSNLFMSTNYKVQDHDTSLSSVTATSAKSRKRQDTEITAAEISPYYRRDRDDNSTRPLPPSPILQLLLNGRWQARQTKNATRVREIDNELQTNYGIYVYDHPPIWTRQVIPPLAWWRKRAEVRNLKQKEMYGPTRHPLRYVGTSETSKNSGSVLPEPLIHAQLSQWMYHFTRNSTQQQERADAIQFELSLHGVNIDRTRLEWTTSVDDLDYDHTTAYPRNRQEHSNFNGTLNVSVMSQNNTDDSHIKKRQRIEHLIEQYIEASMTGRHWECVFLSWELATCYGVQWNRHTNSWDMTGTTSKPPNITLLCQELSSHGFPFEEDLILPPLVFHENTTAWKSPMYKQSTQSEDMDPLILHRVRYLAQERIHKREESKYVESDAIRYELWHTYVSTAVFGRQPNQACASWGK
jgi:hypothetical protein